MKMQHSTIRNKLSRSLFALTFAGALGAQASYAADPVEEQQALEQFGIYVSGFVGVGFTDDADFSGIVTPPGGPQRVATDFDEGVHFGGAIGLKLENWGNESFTPRIELELSYLESDADTIDFSGNGVGLENNVDGDISRLLVMANALVDFNTDSAITPYLGVGIGVAFSDTDIVYGGAPGAAPPIRFGDSETDFAAQAIIGASYEVSDTTSIFIDGRYSRIFDVSGDRFNPGGLTGNIEDDVSSFSINIGVRYAF